MGIFPRREKTARAACDQEVPGPGKRTRLIDGQGALGSSILVCLLIVVLGPLFAWRGQASAISVDNAPLAAPRPTDRCAHAAHRHHRAARPVKVSSASGLGATMNVVIGRNGGRQERHSASLTIQKGRLCPGSILATAASDLIRADGQTLPPYQVASWAQVDKYGTHVTVWVVIAPRRGQVSGSGGYAGTVALNDHRAEGGAVAVHVHVLYPNLNLVLALSLLAGFGGFTWAWFVHDLGREDGDPIEHANFLRNLTLRIAVVLVAAIPVVNVQVLGNPDWQGSLSQFIGLATLAGAAAIAATPTLRALALRAKLRASPTPASAQPEAPAPAGAAAQPVAPAGPAQPAAGPAG